MRRYVEAIVIPRLRKEGWDKAILTTFPFAPKFSYMERWESKFFIGSGLCPVPRFLRRFERLTNLLENCPDGYLIKLKRTGKWKRLADALLELGLQRFGLEIGGHVLSVTELDDKVRLPVINGDVEVVEVKSGRSFIAPSQLKSYQRILKKGFVLRHYHVDFVSFEENTFELTETVVKRVGDLRRLARLERRVS